MVGWGVVEMVGWGGGGDDGMGWRWWDGVEVEMVGWGGGGDDGMG